MTLTLHSKDMSASEVVSPTRDSTLQLSRQEMRALGEKVLNLILDHFEKLSEKTVTTSGGRTKLEKIFREPVPELPSSFEAVFAQVRDDVFGNIMHQDHPRCFSFIPGPSNFVSVMADALASAFNVISADWLEASGPSQVELVTIDWLRQLCGFPASAGGLFVSGGSMANLTALGVARHVKLGDKTANAVIYCSDQTHSSIDRAWRILGFGRDQICKLPCDENYRLPVAALRRQIQADRAADRIPFCVIANAGTTNTGSVDPLAELASLGKEENLWLHVDGAYGAAAVLCNQGQKLLEGLGQADSLILDPHKWLFQPYEMGCVLVRDMGWLKEAYCVRPEYLADVHGIGSEIHYCDYGIQLTRSFRALKLWMSLKVFGLAAFREAVMYGIETAEFAESLLRKSSHWEITSSAQLGMLTFRYRLPLPQGGSDLGRSMENAEDTLNQRLASEIIRDGYASLTTTKLRGRTVLRMCSINPRTTEEDIRNTLARLEVIAAQQL